MFENIKCFLIIIQIKVRMIMGKVGAKLENMQKILMTNEFKQEVFAFHTKKNSTRIVSFLFIYYYNKHTKAENTTAVMRKSFKGQLYPDIFILRLS